MRTEEQWQARLKRCQAKYRNAVRVGLKLHAELEQWKELVALLSRVVEIDNYLLRK